MFFVVFFAKNLKQIILQKSKMPKIAYVRNTAPGFTEDAEELLNEFVALNTHEFFAFAEIWRKRKFSFIFMGRENTQELNEFTQECFCIVAQYISTTTPYITKVGAIYLLYSLYLKQRLNPKTQIRIHVHQWKEIQRILRKATELKHKTLCYIIHYMHSEIAFSYVALPKLMGPMTSVGTSPKEPTAENKLKCSAEEVLQSGAYEVLSQLHNQYMQAKNALAADKSKGLNILLDNKYDEAARQLSTLIKEEIYVRPDKHKTKRTTEEDNIGVRRTIIKQKQFEKKTEHYLLKSQSESQPSDPDDPDDPAKDSDYSPKKVKRKRTRRRGRRRKSDLSAGSEVDAKTSEDDLKPDVLDRLPPCKKSRKRPMRKVHHYAEHQKPKQR